MKAPRIWWICFDGDPKLDRDLEKRYVSGTEFTPIANNEEVICVVDKEAYDEMTNLVTSATAEIERLKREFKKLEQKAMK